MSYSANSTLSTDSAANPGTVDSTGTLDAGDWTQLVPDISDSGPVMAFNTGNADGSFYNTWPTVSGDANGWFLIQWLHNQNLDPAQMIVNDAAITDPTYGHPEYTFTTPDGEEELNVYNSNGSYYYDIRESGGLFQGAGANIILQTEVTQPNATFNHQINFSLDAKISEATVGTIPGQNAGVPTVICGVGFEISFNAVGSANYDASLASYTVMFQLPISQTANVSTFLYPQNYGLQLGAGAAALQNVSGEVVNGEEQLALQADGGALHSLSYNLNYYLEAMLAQSTYTDPTTGAVGALPSAYTDLSRWSVSGAYIGDETTNQDPNVVGNASIGLMFGNVNFTIDQNSTVTYSAPTINNHTPTIIQPASGPAPTTLYAQGQATPTPTVGDVSLSNGGTADVQGVGVTGDVIVLFDGASTVGSAVVDAQGNWSVSGTGTLGEGTHPFSAVQYDTLGNAGSASAVVDYVVAPAAPAITGVAQGANTSGTVAGTGSAGDVIILSDGAVTIGSATVTATGTWDVQSASLLSAQNHSFSAVEEDASGNVSSASQHFAYSVPAAIVVANCNTVTVANASTVVVTGTLDTVNLTGTADVISSCASTSMTVNGSGSSVSVGKNASATVNGFNNNVTASSGAHIVLRGNSNSLIAAASSVVTLGGQNNNVSLGSGSTIWVMTNQNTVVAQSNSTVDLYGNSNEVCIVGSGSFANVIGNADTIIANMGTVSMTLYGSNDSGSGGNHVTACQLGIGGTLTLGSAATDNMLGNGATATLGSGAVAWINGTNDSLTAQSGAIVSRIAGVNDHVTLGDNSYARVVANGNTLTIGNTSSVVATSSNDLITIGSGRVDVSQGSQITISFITAGGADTIKGFKAAAGDKIDLKNLLSGTHVAADLSTISNYISLQRSGADDILTVTGLSGPTHITLLGAGSISLPLLQTQHALMFPS